MSQFSRNGFIFQLLASGDICRLRVTFANSLDPDQDRQKVGPDLDLNRLTLWWCSWKILLENVNFEDKKKSADDHKNKWKKSQHATF